jgi:hypothetical protein
MFEAAKMVMPLRVQFVAGAICGALAAFTDEN